ncbi:MAG: GIN domain-containing protein [Muribaculaceae bacterium]
MRKIITMAIAMLMAAGVCASAKTVNVKASGKIVKKEITGKSGFKEITVGGAVKVIYHCDANTRIVVSASDNIIPYIEVEKKGSRLEVGIKKDVSISLQNSKSDLNVIVYAPDVTAFSVSGSGGIDIRTDLKADRLAFGASGSGDIDALNLKADEVAIGVTGSGDIDVRDVKAKKIALGVTGNGDIKP